MLTCRWRCIESNPPPLIFSVHVVHFKISGSDLDAESNTTACTVYVFKSAIAQTKNVPTLVVFVGSFCYKPLAGWVVLFLFLSEPPKTPACFWSIITFFKFSILCFNKQFNEIISLKFLILFIPFKLYILKIFLKYIDFFKFNSVNIFELAFFFVGKMQLFFLVRTF